jgi:hypothetical protein
MSRFRKVSSGTWGDEKFDALSESAKLLWFYLLTGPETTSLPGLIVIGRAALAEAMKWDVRKLDRAFGELKSSGMAVADWRARLVWLPKGVRHNAPQNPSVVQGWREHLKVLPGCPLKRQAISGLASEIEKLPDNMVTAFLHAADVTRDEFSSMITEYRSSHHVPHDGPHDDPHHVPHGPSRARESTAPAPALSPEEHGEGNPSARASSAVDPPAEPPKRPHLDPSVAVPTYTEGCQMALREISSNPKATWPRWSKPIVDELAAMIEAFAPDAADGQVVLDWVRATAYRYRLETHGDAKYQAGWRPSKCSEWLMSPESQVPPASESGVNVTRPPLRAALPRGVPAPEGPAIPPPPELLAFLEDMGRYKGTEEPGVDVRLPARAVNDGR